MAVKSGSRQLVLDLLDKNRYNSVELTVAMMKADSSTGKILMDHISKEVKREQSWKRFFSLKPFLKNRMNVGQHAYLKE